MSKSISAVETETPPSIYTVLPLVTNIPLASADKEISVQPKITTIESWDSSIYVGTSGGEILHFFRDSSGMSSEGESPAVSYILASRQRTHTKKIRPASKIIILPSISRAIVLSQSTASVFTLPEFAPVSGIGSLRDINDICRDIDDKSILDTSHNVHQTNGVLVTVFTKASIRFVRVFPTALKAEQKVDYPSGALMGLQRSNFALVANDKTYDLVDLQNKQKIPLFEICTGGNDSEEEQVEEASVPSVEPIETKKPSDVEEKPEDGKKEDVPEETKDKTTESKTEETATSEPFSEQPPEQQQADPVKLTASKKLLKKIRPMVCPVGTDEFLVTSGTKVNEPSMGLVVNSDGDISRGTIAWPKYPDSIAVDYPYVAAVIDSEIQFYSLHDQVLVQTIPFKTPPTVTTVSSPISQPYPPLADKIRLVPLVPVDEKSKDNKDLPIKDQEARIEKERKTAEALSVISSSLFVYSEEDGVQCLLASPRIFHLESLVDLNRIDEVKEEMENLEINSERAFVEIEYLGLLVGLGYLLHEDFENATEAWLRGTLDPRVVVYTYDKTCVRGEMWIFNGLLPLVDRIIENFNKLKSGPETESLATEHVEPQTSKKSKKGSNSKKNKHQKQLQQKQLRQKNIESGIAAEELSQRLSHYLQYYAYFLQEWIKRRDLESVVDKSNTFYTLELAYLNLLLSSLDSQKLPPGSTFKISDPKTAFYHFIKTEIIESTDTTIEILGKNGKYYGQFLLYQKYKRTDKLCELWQQIISKEVEDPDFVPSKPQDFVNYLRNDCTNKELIWKYGLWLLDSGHLEALLIFTHRNRMRADEDGNGIYFDDLELLKAFKELKNQQPWKEFLKFLVYERHDLRLQGDLIEITVDDLLEKINNSKQHQKEILNSYQEYKELPLPKRGYLDFLQSRMARGIDKEITQLRLDLLRLLLFDGQYDVNLIRKKLEQCKNPNAKEDDNQYLLVIELCVVYSRLDMHNQCLHILATFLWDYEQAIDYCKYGRLIIRGLDKWPTLLDHEKLQTGQQQSLKQDKTEKASKKKTSSHSKASSSASSVTLAEPSTHQFLPLTPVSFDLQKTLFNILFDEFLAINTSTTQYLYTRMLLDSYGYVYLDIFEVLNRVPEEWSLQILDEYLLKFLRQLKREKTVTTLEKSLARVENGYINGLWRTLEKAQKMKIKQEEEEENRA